ncbi:MAG: type II toxin-antitoxin system VapC family toxin [Synechococcales cyanobacterium T60_A2020_003]|nr:type II toxin-antitoxin system VapC family toxin [Synechococcales cyanobacterium T60_A2020_003]
MTKLFVDTSRWASFFDSREPTHRQAAQILTTAYQNQHTIVTSNYILTELVSLLHSPLRIPRSKLFTIIDTIKATPYLDIIHIDLATDADAWNLCKSRSDRAWSLVDCSSFILMQRQNIQAALTTDRHFDQAGFIRLLNSSTL